MHACKKEKCFGFIDTHKIDTYDVRIIISNKEWVPYKIFKKNPFSGKKIIFKTSKQWSGNQYLKVTENLKLSVMYI